MAKKKMNQKQIIAILAILLVLAIAYIVGSGVYENIAEQRQQEQLSAFQQGAQYGQTQLVQTLFQQAATCQQVPVTVDNQTINLVAVECLQQAQAQR